MAPKGPPMVDFTKISEVSTLINSDWTQAQAQEIFRNLSTLITTLQTNTGLDEQQPVSVTRGDLWNALASRFLASGDIHLAELVYSSWLRRFYELQADSRRRLHKGGPLHQLGVIFLVRDQEDTARRLFLLAFIEDMLSDPARMTEYPSYNVLRHVLQVPEQTLVTIRRDVERRIAGKQLALHPEEVLVEHTLETVSRQYRPWERGSPIINPLYASELFSGVAEAAIPKDKGDALEKLVAYLVETAEGLELAGAKVKTHEYEFDLLVRNLVLDDPIFEELGAYILVECKNWEEKVEVGTISHFVEKLRSTKCRTGILVARHGVTGEQLDKDRSRVEAARLSILKAHYQDNVVIIVLDESDLRRLTAAEVSLRSVIMQGYENIRFDWRRPLA